jgi:hypothetical protein
VQAHVGGGIVGHVGAEAAGVGVEDERVGVEAGGAGEAGEAAGAVAAHGAARAVGVVVVHAEVRPVGAVVEREQAVGADAFGAAAQVAREGGKLGLGERVEAVVEDDEVVARTVHLRELDDEEALHGRGPETREITEDPDAGRDFSVPRRGGHREEGFADGG